MENPNELAIVQKPGNFIRNVDDLGRVGNMMAKSGYFTDARDAAQASVKVMAGMEMGFGAFASMTGIYIIQGKPSVGANLMASAVKANTKYDYRVREISEKCCKIEFFEILNGKRESIGESSFTIDEARKAGVKNLDKFARNMLFARAMSNGIRWFCPDVFAGNATYTPEELGADVDGEGNVIKVEAPEKPVQSRPEAQAPVIEGEIIENAPQPKPVFDEVEYLKKFQVPGGVTPMFFENAKEFVSQSNGQYYVEMPTKDLRSHLIGLWKKLKETEDQDIRDGINIKISAICAIMLRRKSEIVSD